MIEVSKYFMRCAIRVAHLWSPVHYPAKNTSQTVLLSGVFIADGPMTDANAMEIMQSTIAVITIC